MQMKIQQMEQEESDRHLASRQKKMVAAEATLINKQSTEMLALRKKIESVENGQLKQREDEQNK